MAPRRKRRPDFDTDPGGQPSHRAKVPRAHLAQEKRDIGDMETVSQLTAFLRPGHREAAQGLVRPEVIQRRA